MGILIELFGGEKVDVVDAVDGTGSAESDAVAADSDEETEVPISKPSSPSSAELPLCDPRRKGG